MSYSNIYTVPSYYESFACKGPACRHTCCIGWPISISMKEYFTLLGIDCSSELRNKLDRSFCIPKYPDKERYAQILPTNESGDCNMHLSNGLCALHLECGEDILPYVCRYYPRGSHLEFLSECSMSNSCEKVLELLFEQEKLNFSEKKLTFAGDAPKYNHTEEEKSFYKRCRIMCISILQNRSRSLSDRIIILGQALKELHEIEKHKNYINTEDILSKYSDQSLIKVEALSDLEYSIPIQAELVSSLALETKSMGFYADKVLNYYGLSDTLTPENLNNAINLYKNADKHLNEVLPLWERYFENLLINHIFFEQFPFSDKHENIKDEFISLTATYAFLRFITLGYMADKTEIKDFIDLNVAAFRLIDHSPFDYNCAIIMRKIDCYSLDKLSILLKA